MDTPSRKRLRLENSLANNQEDEVQNVTNSNPRLNRKIEFQQNVDNTDNKMDIADMVKLYENGEFTQEMLDQALSVQERFIYFYLSTTLNRAISFLFKSELTKIVDIRKADKMKCNSDLMIYYKRAPIIFPQILAQLCPNIIDFRKMNQSNVSHVAFLNEYKENIPKYSETGLEYIPKNKFSAYMDLFAQSMPHIIEMMISKIGVDGVKVMMEAFNCEQETIDAIFNLVKEFKVKIDDTYLRNKRRKIEETIALLLKCPNAKTVDISLVTKNREKESYSSPIIDFFNSMPSSFTQAFAQLCPRIEQILDNGDFIFDSQLFSSYARGTNGRCNLSHVNLIQYRNCSEMQRQKLQYYVDCCYKIKSLEISFDTCIFLIESSSSESSKNLLDKLKYVEDMKLESDNTYRLNNNDFVIQFLLMFTALKHLDLKIINSDMRVREIFATINTLPSLRCIDLYVGNIDCLELIHPSMINKLSVIVLDTRPEQMNLFANLYNLRSLTLCWANNNIIPFVSQLNLTMLCKLKHLKIKFFNGDRTKLFSAAIALSQNIKFDFECFRYEVISLHDVIRDVISARHTIFNKILLHDNSVNNNDHVILHLAITKLESSRIRDGFHLHVTPETMKSVERCKLCKQLLVKNTLFNIYIASK